MKCPPEYWIWLQSVLGEAKKLDEILSYYGDPKSLYESKESDRRSSKLFTRRDLERASVYTLEDSKKIIDACDENGWKIITYDDDFYPPLLKEMIDYPAVLYVWGDETALLSKVIIGMVGTRKSTEYGLRVAESLAGSLSEAGCVIVSGGAVGIDKASHRGAVMAGGKTIAVLGNGLGCRYLAENEKMREVISKNGAVISEYPPFTPPSKRTFPVRNRIISGLSLGTVVIEAGEKSGSLITAGCALEQGRDVFAIPGDIMSPGFLGTNALIRDGAKPVFTAMDVLESYCGLYGEYLNIKEEFYEPLKPVTNRKYDSIEYKPKENKKSKKQPKEEDAPEKENPKTEDKNEIKTLPEFLSEDAKTVYKALDGKSLLSDEIIEITNLSPSSALSALTELEMYSLIKTESGMRYTIT